MILATGTIVPAGTLRPGAEPVEGLTNSDASVKTLASDETSALEDPTLAGEVMKGESDETAATVVSSLMTMNPNEDSESHGPSAVIILSAVLFVPGARPGFPPEATI